jgi:hypothetical protein
MLRKGLVTGIIILFVGASITTGLGSDIKNDFSTENIKPDIVSDSYRDDWWDEDWEFRKKIEISNVSSDCQMLLLVWKEDGYDNVSDGSVDCENHCNDDFSDIRFIDLCNSVLSYWIENITVDNDHCAKIWVKLSCLDTIYMYYGNPNASDLSNGDDTFIFFDHFEEEILNSTKWDTSNIGLYVNDYLNSSIGFHGNWGSAGDPGKDLRINTSYILFNMPIRIEARLKCGSYGDIDLFVSFNGALGGSDRIHWDYDINQGITITIGGDYESFGKGFTDYNWHRCGGSFSMYSHSVWSDWEDTYYKNGVAASSIGYIGIGADTDDDNRYGYFDWIAVREFCSYEPFISFIGFEEVANKPPYAPVIDGSIEGKPGKSYVYSVNSTDPEGHDVWYYIDWGDDTYDDWFGPHPSGIEFEVSHTFDNHGTFIIYAKSKDIYDLESDWGKFTVTMPRNRLLTNPFLLQFLERFPFLQRLLCRFEVLIV